jgi:hypothetical protein
MFVYLRLAVLCLVLALVGSALAADDPKAPKGHPPQFMVIKDVNMEAKQLVTTSWVMGNLAIKKDGDKVILSQDVQQRDNNVALDSVNISTVGGKKIDGEAALKALKGQVVVVTNLESVDPLFLKALAKDTIVITNKPAKK